METKKRRTNLVGCIRVFTEFSPLREERGLLNLLILERYQQGRSRQELKVVQNKMVLHLQSTIYQALG